MQQLKKVMARPFILILCACSCLLGTGCQNPEKSFYGQLGPGTKPKLRVKALRKLAVAGELSSKQFREHVVVRHILNALAGPDRSMHREAKRLLVKYVSRGQVSPKLLKWGITPETLEKEFPGHYEKTVKLELEHTLWSHLKDNNKYK